MARALSLIVAVVASLGGHALLFFGAYYIQIATARASGSTDLPVFVVPVILLGVLIVGVTALTAAWSSLGVIVVGIVDVLVGAAGVFIPFRLASGGTGRGAIDGMLLRLGPAGQIADAWLVLGLALIEGVLLLALGWATARRRRALVTNPGVARVLSVVIVFVGLAPATLLAVNGGYREYVRLAQYMSGPDLLAAILLVVGVLLLAGLMITVRWSGLGAIVWGALLAVTSLGMSLISVLLPTTSRAVNPLGLVYRGLPIDLANTVLTNLGVGGIAVVAVTFLLGGIASVRAGRVGRRRDSYVRPPTGEVPEVEPRFLTQRPTEESGRTPDGTSSAGV